jgi:hypothetical protein
MPETQLLLKVIAGTVLIIALIIGFLERMFRPSYLMLESSRSFPSWIGWLGWGMTTFAALTYISCGLRGLERLSPNFSSSGRAISGVPSFGVRAARRSTRR